MNKDLIVSDEIFELLLTLYIKAGIDEEEIASQWWFKNYVAQFE